MHILSPETDNCPSWISRRDRMTAENISWSISTNVARLDRDQTCDLQITSQMHTLSAGRPGDASYTTLLHHPTTPFRFEKYNLSQLLMHRSEVKIKINTLLITLIIWTSDLLFVWILNGMSNLVGHFVSSPRERQKRDRRTSTLCNISVKE